MTEEELKKRELQKIKMRNYQREYQRSYRKTHQVQKRFEKKKELMSSEELFIQGFKDGLEDG